MSIAEKLVTIAENEQRVYKAGQKSMVDESKIIERTVTGKGIVRVDDVSEIPHEVSVKLSVEPQYDYLLEDVGLSREWEKSYYYSPSFSAIEGRTYIITASQEYLDDYTYAYYGHIAEADWLANTDTTDITLPLQDEAVFNLQGETTVFVAPKTAEYRFFIHEEPSPAGMIALSVKSETIRDLSGTEVIVSGTNLFDVSKVENSKYITNNGDGTITISGIYGAGTGRTLRELCPSLKAGDTVVLRIESTGNKVIYLGDSKYTWHSAYARTLTEEDLNSIVNVYGQTDKGTYTISQIWINYGTTALNYEPYVDTVFYSTNEDGAVNGVKPLCPTMVVKTDDDIDITLTYHQSWGIQYERDRFWDKFQNYGKRTDYSYAMGGQGLVDSGYLPPKYPMVLSSAHADNYNMFAYFNREATEPYDMTEICKLLDCSKAKRMQGFFYNSKVKNITLDMSECTISNDMFSGSMIGCKIDNVTLKVTEKLTTATSMFYACGSLITLRFTEDSVINVALSFAQSSLLSAESVDSIIHALKDLTGQTAKKITFHTDVVGRMTEEQKSKILAKNWQIG